jgi:hypothetical protein
MRFQDRKISARATALALAIGVVGVLITTALPAFAVAAPTAFTPVCGVVGTPVTITGSGLTGTTGVVFPGAINQTTVTNTNDNSITANVPVGSSGTATLTVHNPGGDGVTAGSFQVITPAVAPTITSFSPPTGGTGSSVVIVGSGFCGATSVAFNLTNATFTVNSNNQITAVVPAGATTGPIHVTSNAGTIASATNFTPASATTITSFTPTSGPVGTSVVITGTGFVTVTSVKFNGVAAVSPVTNSATQITATVPSGATTGPITVVDAGGTATSTTSFTVTTAPVVTKHHRTVTLSLKGQLTASGTVKVKDGFNACRSGVTVKIQRLKNGAWQTVGTDKTTGNGKYSKNIEDKSGKYRAIAKKKKLNGGDDICVADTSPTVHHTHH